MKGGDVLNPLKLSGNPIKDATHPLGINTLDPLNKFGGGNSGGAMTPGANPGGRFGLGLREDRAGFTPQPWTGHGNGNMPPVQTMAPSVMPNNNTFSAPPTMGAPQGVGGMSPLANPVNGTQSDLQTAIMHGIMPQGGMNPGVQQPGMPQPMPLAGGGLGSMNRAAPGMIPNNLYRG